MELLLFAAFLVFSAILVPLGFPGTWLMVVGGVAYNYLTGTDAIGWVAIVGCTIIALVGEIGEYALTARYTERYGGSRRAGWGAVLGGMVGAIMGVPVPLVGSVIGAFVGSFVGALVFEYTRHADHTAATRVATGALIGRVVATALKVALACVIATWLFVVAWA